MHGHAWPRSEEGALIRYVGDVQKIASVARQRDDRQGQRQSGGKKQASDARVQRNGHP
jgi:hypothetical protein